MIYPRDIVDFISNDKEARAKFGELILNNNLNTSKKILTGDTKLNFELWMHTTGKYHSFAIKRYLFFLSLMSKIFNEVRDQFIAMGTGRSSHQKDSCAILSNPTEMLEIARYVYYLKSYGVVGDILECGCYYGFSSCCLSWVCEFLELRLIVADSFQGLPDVSHAYYRPGDFACDFETVKKNVSAFGRIKNVDFIPGFYSQSLSELHRKISLIWMDVDLYESAHDVLSNVYPSLEQGGVIFTHEFTPDAFKNEQCNPQTALDPLRAVHDFFSTADIEYKGRYIVGDLGIIIPQCGKDANILIHTGTLTSHAISTTIKSKIKSKIKSRAVQIKRGVDYYIDTINGIVLGDKNSLEIDFDADVSICGWLIDRRMEDAASIVFISTNTTDIPLLKERIPRLDVARSFNNEMYRLSGFEITIPCKLLVNKKICFTVGAIPSADNYWYISHESYMLKENK